MEAGGVYQGDYAKSTPAQLALFARRARDYLNAMRPRSSLRLSLKSPFQVRWEIAPGLVPYEEGLARMERETQAIARGEASELVWLLEHPPLYTAGTSATDSDLIAPGRFPVFRVG